MARDRGRGGHRGGRGGRGRENGRGHSQAGMHFNPPPPPPPHPPAYPPGTPPPQPSPPPPPLEQQKHQKIVRDNQHWPTRPKKEDFDKWLQNKAKWPCPAGTLDGSVDIFWDMDNVALYHPCDITGLRPHDQYDLLLKVFGKDNGPKVSVHLYVAIAQDRLDAYGPQIKSEITRVHPDVTIHIVQGKHVGGKTEISDNTLKGKMSMSIARGRRGDTIVMITGDSDFESEARRAKNANMNVFLLTPAWAATSQKLFETVHWQQYFRRFVELHKQRYLPKRVQEHLTAPKVPLTKKKGRPNPAKSKTLEQMRREGAILEMAEYKEHHKEESEQTKLDILIIIDATASMQPYIDSIKDALSNKMVHEIVLRYPSSRGNVRYGVLAYRDVQDEKQFERLDFTTNTEAVVNFLSDLRAKGGKDYAEDVLGAMLDASKSFNWQMPNRAVFHILDAPAHGREMHELGSRNDNWYESTMPGREAPLTEARKALVGLQENGVQRYMMCLLEKPHCAKMLRAFQETLREEGREKTPEDSLWLVDTEVERDPDGKAEPSKMRLESLVGKLLGATLSTLSASISRASLMRKMGPTVRNKEYGVDTEMSVILEESDSEEGPSEPASGVATPPTEPGDAEGTKEDEVPVPDKPRRMFEWNLFGREKKKWEKKVKRYQDEFKKMRRKAPTTQVELLMPPDYKDDLELICEDIDDGELKHGQSPHDKYREYLIRKAPPQGFEGTYKVAFLAQEQFKGERKIERKAADGSVIKYSEYSKQYPIVVLKEFKTFGKGENSAQRYKKEIKVNGIAAALAAAFNGAVKRLKLTPPPKTLSYLETSLVSYQDTPSGGTKKQDPATIFRLMEPLVPGKFRKWTNNGGFVNMEDWEDTAGAFGHWTYVATEGRLMVSDLQGVCVGHHSLKLTDPQVHCARTPELTAHEASCFGRVGMLKFFQSHQCNYICKELGLPDALEEISKLQSDLDELTNSDGDVDGAADAVAGMSVRD